MRTGVRHNVRLQKAIINNSIIVKEQITQKESSEPTFTLSQWCTLMQEHIDNQPDNDAISNDDGVSSKDRAATELNSFRDDLLHKYKTPEQKAKENQEKSLLAELKAKYE